MFHTILVPLDGSSLAEHALPLAIGIAERSQGTLRLARVHRPVAYVTPAAPDNEEVRRAEQRYLDTMAGRLRDTYGVTVTTALLSGAVAAALDAEAQESKADLIVLTTHGRGLVSRFWLGSVADELLRHSPVPLLIHRPGPAKLGAPVRFRRMLVPLDGSEVADVVLASATELARLMQAEVTLLRVVEPVPLLAPDGVTYLSPSLEGPMLDDLKAQASANLDQSAERLRDAGVQVQTHLAIHEQVAGAILEAAESVDLIALATHGRGRVARFFLGSVADKVVRGAPCPVFVVRSHTTAGGLS